MTLETFFTLLGGEQLFILGAMLTMFGRVSKLEGIIEQLLKQLKS